MNPTESGWEDGFYSIMNFGGLVEDKSGELRPHGGKDKNRTSRTCQRCL